MVLNSANQFTPSLGNEVKEEEEAKQEVINQELPEQPQEQPDAPETNRALDIAKSFVTAPWRAHKATKLDLDPSNWTHAMGMGLLDLPIDAIGRIPGLGVVNDKWDEITGFDDPNAQKFREIAGPILATIYTQGKLGGAVTAANLPATTAAAANVGGGIGIAMGIAGLSDYGGDAENRLLLHPDNFERLAKAAPWFAGPNGMFPSLADLADADATDPKVNRLLGMLDEGVLQGVGDLIAYALTAGRPLLKGILPSSKKSKAWKSKLLLDNLELDTKAKVADIDEVINSGGVSNDQIKVLSEEKAKLINQAVTTGSSDATQNIGESIIKGRQNQRQTVRDGRAIRKLKEESAQQSKNINVLANQIAKDLNVKTGADDMWNQIDDIVNEKAAKPISEKSVKKKRLSDQFKGQVDSLGQSLGKLTRTLDDQLQRRADNLDARSAALNDEIAELNKFDPDITPQLASETELAGISTTPPGAAVKNVVDVDAQIAGAIDPLDVPTNPITDAMLDGMILGPNSRKAIAHIALKAKEADNYQAVQGLFRTNNKVADERVYEIYNRIMREGTGDGLRELLKNKHYRDTKGLLNEVKKKIDVTYLDDAGAADAAALAINDLVNVYLGREVTESSARVMHTLGAEISAKAGVPVQFKNLVDDAQVFKNIEDKLEVLNVEYGLSKYIAGAQLQRRNWWKRLLASEDPGEIAELTLKEFGDKQTQIKGDYKAFRQQLQEAAAKSPKLRRTLMKAYDASNGNVDTLLKLKQYNKYHLSPLGLLYSREAKELGISGWQMNHFASGAWAVTYNNVLSGLSFGRAAIGNASLLILKPIASFSRAGLSSILKRDMEPLERVAYLYGSMFETAGRAFDDALVRMKKVHQDPDFMMKAARKDFLVEQSNQWEILDDYGEQWLKDGDYYNNFMYGWANWQRKIARQAWFRTGITGMSSVDAYTDTFMATFQSRLEAYSDVMTKHGKSLDPEVFKAKVKEAEKVSYSNMFNADGLLTDTAAKRASGEIALNLDDGFSKTVNPLLNKIPPLKSLMMFPRTSMNQLKLALSYTPLGAIPGISKYGDILNAGDDMNKIRKVLADHGIRNADEHPNAMAIYKNIREEYEGRLMMGAGAVGLSYMYAMAGGVRGNGPVSHNELVKLKKKGWKPNTVKIGNTWVSYKGIPFVEQYLNLMGDMAFYQTALGTNMTEEFHRKAIWTIAATYLNQTPLQGLEPISAMLRGDEGAFKRLAAQNIRAASLMSGAHGVIAKAITNAQKEIYNDFLGYVRNNTIFKDMSYSKIDHWTGEEIDEIDNPILRALNAINPIKVHGGGEPWRVWLLNSGFDDIAEIKTSSKGIEYSPEARELIGRYMGKQQLWKEVEKMSKSKAFNEDLDKLRKYINSGKDEAEVGEFRNELTVYKKLKSLVNNAKAKAERQIADDPRFAHLDILGLGKAKVKRLMGVDEIDEAAAQARKNYKTKQEFLKYGTTK